MHRSVRESFISLKNYCESENFRGWDPYDGLNSKVFQITPLRHWDLARLAWIQGFKRSPVNLRKLLLVPKEYNPKGIALFLKAYCNIYNFVRSTGDNGFGSTRQLGDQIRMLTGLLISLQSRGYSGSCWGYNFDWQSRRSFLFPKYTPTVVATSFCGTALLSAYEITGDEDLLRTVLSTAEFITEDLHRTPKKRGFLFSYSPLYGNNTVYNASLLGSKMLSYCYSFSKDEKLKNIARESVMACLDAQKPDGSWVYGELPSQNWIDSFHTGYNLEALQVYHDCTGDKSVIPAIEKGFEFYINNFFHSNGAPLYYHNKTYPIDIHCPGQLFVTLGILKKFSDNSELAEKVMDWTINNMQDKRGFFYYQIKRGISSKISYMRWSNAFMFYAMSYYITSGNNLEESRKILYKAGTDLLLKDGG